MNPKRSSPSVILNPSTISTSVDITEQEGSTSLNDDNKDDIFHMYELYFWAARITGMLPLHFDLKTHSVKIIKGGIPRLLCRLNIIYCFIYLIKQPLILYYNVRTEYKYETMKSGFMFQSLWVFGYLLISSTFLNQMFKLKTVATTITMWLKLEHFVEVRLLPEPLEKRKKRIKFLKIQFIIYIGAILGCFLTLTAMAFFIPRFPPFINSIMLTNPNNPKKAIEYFNDKNLSFRTKFLMILRKYGFSLMESYTGIFAWTILGSFDVLISMMCRTICYAMDKLKELVILKDGLHEEELGLYHSLRIIVTNMNLAYGRVLFFQELFNMGTTVLVLYGALNTTDSIILTAFFISNSIALTLRIYLLYLPMSTVYMKSKDFKEFIAAKLLEAKESRVTSKEGRAVSGVRRSAKGLIQQSINVPGNNDITTITSEDEKRIERKVSTFRYMVFRPLGFHRISPTSILDYMLAVMSYLVTVKNI